MTTTKHRLWLEDAEDRKRLLVDIDGRLDRCLAGDLNAMTTGDEIRFVKGDVHEMVTGALIRTVSGAYALTSDGEIELSGERIRIMAGGSSIVIDSSGITINGRPLLKLRSCIGDD